MRFTSSTSIDGVLERDFTLGDIPGVLWAPDVAAGPRPLILMGHGGGQHRKTPGIAGRAHRFAGNGYAVAAIDVPNHGDRPRSEEFDQLVAGMRAGTTTLAALHDHLAGQTVADWQTVITAVQQLDHVGAGPVGYCGMSMGCGLGVPLVAAEPRIGAAVLGMLGVDGLAETAARITVPVQFQLQWDDRRVPRDEGLALFDALGSKVKTLHANPGDHGEIPGFEMDGWLRFFGRHLG